MTKPYAVELSRNANRSQVALVHADNEDEVTALYLDPVAIIEIRSCEDCEMCGIVCDFIEPPEGPKCSVFS